MSVMLWDVVCNTRSCVTVERAGRRSSDSTSSSTNTTSTEGEANESDDMIVDENSSNSENEGPRMPVVMTMTERLSTTGHVEVAGFGDGWAIIDWRSTTRVGSVSLRISPCR